MKNIIFIFFCLACIITNTCFALVQTKTTLKSNNTNSQINQNNILPIGTSTKFTAGVAECQQQKNNSNVCVYSDNATFISGNKKLLAPTITVYRDKHNQIEKIVADADKKGNQACYQGGFDVQDKTNSNKKNIASAKEDSMDKQNLIIAHANKITIYTAKNLMLLEGNADIVKNDDIMNGDYLEYNMQQQTIFSKPNNDNGLTTIVFNQKSVPNQIHNYETGI